MVCRVRNPVRPTGCRFAPYAICASAAVARRKLRVCGACSAVAIRWVTKIELGRDSGRTGAGDHGADGAVGTSATQAGCGAGTVPSSAACSGRPLLNIANRNPAELSRFGTSCAPANPASQGLCRFCAAGSRALSSEVEPGSRQENASTQESRAPVSMLSKRKMAPGHRIKVVRGIFINFA
jgi:hypothetical protein